MLSAQTMMGKILRSPLSLIPREAEVRVLRGPLRGKKWIVGAASHACWVGTYEVDRLRAFSAAISEGATVYDVGANVGIYALLAGVKTGPSGMVYAFEPMARNLSYLRRHIALNEIHNCEIIDAAVSNTIGICRFSAASWEPSMGHLSSDGEIEVSSITLDDCVYGEKACRPPAVMKIDVEGAEKDVLKGARRMLAEFHPVLFIEIHGKQQHIDCSAMLRQMGYQLEEDYGRLTATWVASQ